MSISVCIQRLYHNLDGGRDDPNSPGTLISLTFMNFSECAFAFQVSFTERHMRVPCIGGPTQIHLLSLFVRLFLCVVRF